MTSATDRIFLDANAGVPPHTAALDRVRGLLDNPPANPSSPHAAGRDARALLDDAKDAVARAMGGQSRELVLTSGASEANRWLVDAAVRAGRDRGSPVAVVASPLEHPSLARALEAAAARKEITLTLLAVDREAVVVDPGVLGGAELVFTMGAHSETGILLPMDAIAAALPERAVWCVDVAQTLARTGPLPARADAGVCSAAKIGGFAGAGALLLRRRARALLPAPWAGGGQEGGLRPGTEALVLHAAFGAAAAVIEATRAAHVRLTAERDRLEAALALRWGARVLGQSGPRLPQTSALVVPGVDGDALRMALDRTGVCVGFGTACSGLAPEPSPALRALGLSASEARATVRLSLAAGEAELSGRTVDAALERLSTLDVLLRGGVPR